MSLEINLNFIKSKKLILTLLLILTVLFLVSYFFDNNNIEGFQAPLPPNSHYHLFTADNKFFLFDNYQAIDYQTNPQTFNSYQEYLDYHQKTFGDTFEPLKARPNRRPLDGRGKLPILPYQWMCKRRYAEAVAKHRDCADKIYTRYDEADCKEFLKDNPKNDVFTNYNEEICMVDSFHRDYPEILSKDKIKKVSFSDPLITNIHK